LGLFVKISRTETVNFGTESCKLLAIQVILKESQGCNSAGRSWPVAS